MSAELDRQFRQEWQARKARRFARASQYAEVLGKVSHNGAVFEVRRALRSRGFRSDYEKVPQYWVLISRDGQLVEGHSFTERAYREAAAHALAHSGVKFP